MLVGPCPIHGGDRPNGFNLYPDGYSVRGTWQCYTRGCQRIFQPTLIGFARGILSRNKLGWNGQDEKKTYSFKGTVEYLCDFVGQKLDKIKVDDVLTERNKFVSQCNLLSRERQYITPGWAVGVIREKLIIPSSYYLDRGFDKTTLDRYNIGELKDNVSSSPMWDRVVVPVMDNDGKKVIGIVGRSLFDKCDKCQLWHDSHIQCPSKEQSIQPQFAKWRFSKGFYKEHFLYNYSEAKEYVKKTGKIILVEGPSDCWRLSEAGINNAVALFGIELFDQQQILLEMSGALTCILLLDHDKAGENGIKNIETKLGRMFKIVVPKIEAKDPGELTKEEINALQL